MARADGRAAARTSARSSTLRARQDEALAGDEHELAVEAGQLREWRVALDRGAAHLPVERSRSLRPRGKPRSAAPPRDRSSRERSVVGATQDPHAPPDRPSGASACRRRLAAIRLARIPAQARGPCSVAHAARAAAGGDRNAASSAASFAFACSRLAAFTWPKPRISSGMLATAVG